MLAVRVANKPEQDEPNPSVRIKRRPLSQTTGQKRPRTDHDVHHTCITKKSKGLYQQQCVYHPQHSILLRLSVARINRRRRGCGRHPFTVVSLQAFVKMRLCLRTTFASDFPKSVSADRLSSTNQDDRWLRDTGDLPTDSLQRNHPPDPAGPGTHH